MADQDYLNHPSQDEITGLWGFRSYQTHKVLIPFQWCDARGFGKRLAPVCDCSTGLWGFIDRNGMMISPPRWSATSYFIEEFASVCDPESGLWTFISENGQLLGPPQWQNVYWFSEGLAAVREPTEGRWGYIDTTGRVAIEPRWTQSSQFRDGFACVKADSGSKDNTGVIDRAGRVIIEPEWGHVRFHRYGFLKEAGYFEARMCDDACAIFGMNGEIIFPLHHLKPETDEQLWWADGPETGEPSPAYREVLVHDIPARSRRMIHGANSLSAMAELFVDYADKSLAKIWPFPEIELRAAGLWQRPVTLIQPFDAPCGTCIKAGVSGLIGWTEPATFKMFDLTVVAPVDGLPVPSGATVAVPWHLLKLNE